MFGRVKDHQMTFIEHLGELRKRLFYCALALLVSTLISFTFYDKLLRILLYPAPEGFKPTFIEMTGFIGPVMKISLVGGFILAVPVIAYQTVRFLLPALSPKERTYAILLLPGLSLSFIGGVVFCFFILLPTMTQFLLTFGSEFATPQVTLGSYVNTVTMLLFWSGVSFETPFVMYFLSRIGLISPKGFAGFRKYWFLIAFVLGAMITPTLDPVNQALVAGPLIVLYEVGIWLARIAAWQSKERKPDKAAKKTPVTIDRGDQR